MEAVPRFLKASYKEGLGLEPLSKIKNSFSGISFLPISYILTLSLFYVKYAATLICGG